MTRQFWTGLACGFLIATVLAFAIWAGSRSISVAKTGSGLVPDRSPVWASVPKAVAPTQPTFVNVDFDVDDIVEELQRAGFEFDPEMPIGSDKIILHSRTTSTVR